MINEKLNEIDLDLKIVQSLVKNNDYLKAVEDYCKKNNEREEKIRELQDRIDKAIEYIETLEKREAYKIVDNENGVPSLIVDNEEYLVLCKYNKLLDILKGDNK